MTWLPGSQPSEGWLGRSNAVLLFQHMSEQCADIARALESHRDLDAIEIYARLAIKVASAAKLVIFQSQNQTVRRVRRAA